MDYLLYLNGTFAIDICYPSEVRSLNLDLLFNIEHWKNLNEYIYIYIEIQSYLSCSIAENIKSIFKVKGLPWLLGRFLTSCDVICMCQWKYSSLCSVYQCIVLIKASGILNATMWLSYHQQELHASDLLVFLLS